MKNDKKFIILFLALVVFIFVFSFNFSRADESCVGKGYMDPCITSDGGAGRCYENGGTCILAAPASESDSVLPSPSGGDSPPAVTSGIYFPSSDETGLPDPAGGIVAILTNLLEWLLAVIGLIAIISFLISGIMYFIAAGDEDMAKKAKRAMLYSIIGVVVTLSGYVIVQAVDAALRGSWTI